MVKKLIINELVKSYHSKTIEQHLILAYLKSNNVEYTNSTLLEEYLKDFVLIPKLYFDVTTLAIKSIKELESCLELIIPKEDRRLNGAFFTPDYIIDFILKEIKPKRNDQNLDPSCGCGAFLVGLVDYYKLTYSKSIRDIIRENVFGADVLEYNILRAKLILTIYALQNGEVVYESDFNLFHQDSLRAIWDVQFDNIVGNPPYVKFQDLTDENRVFLSKQWMTVEGGTFNLYFVFFELGYKLLKETGKLGFITPNNYFTSLAGESLRKFFQRRKCVFRILDFSHKKVFDAQSYTAITFLSKQQNESITYDRVKEDFTPEEFLANANGSPNYISNLNTKKWRLLKTDEQESIRTIETIGTRIGKLFDICVGVATLKDEIFFVDGSIEQNDSYVKKTEIGEFEIEKQAVRSVYKISDFKSQKDINRNSRRIIFPYDVKNGIAIPISERDFERRFPKCFKYFLSEKENLLARDKGKIAYEPFFVWGRTQGLTRFGRKILTPTFSQHPRFLLVEDAKAFFTNGYGIYFKENIANTLAFEELIDPLSKVENIDVVQKILNSYIMHYYISKTSVSIEGGYPCYQKNFIENFSIPRFNQDEVDLLKNLVHQNEIDEFLINKYQLNFPVPNLLS